jgi:hypothetical protein
VLLDVLAGDLLLDFRGGDFCGMWGDDRRYGQNTGILRFAQNDGGLDLLPELGEGG